MFRLLVVCFLMLALPFQAFASASMLPRVVDASLAAHAMPAAEPPPCHQQMAKDHLAKAPSAHDGAASQHDKGKCGTCAACCVGAAMASSMPATPAPAPPSTTSIPFRAGHLPSVDPVLPERPPSPLLA
ncbi:hypothetical protein [Massilia aerilata]|uniref:DUF2946 domain-containing protein n=1 Tax=Massilia aerilata TaxID=453817 RepID=A0ABW0RSD0_9BURK